MYEDIYLQMKNYKTSNFTLKIRSHSRTEKFQKDSIIKSLYARLEKGLQGIEFVEAFHNVNYENYIRNNFENGFNDVTIYGDDIEMCDQEITDQSTELRSNFYFNFQFSVFFNAHLFCLIGHIAKCAICLRSRPIIAGFQKCLHICMCSECMISFNLSKDSNGNVKCIICREKQKEAKIFHFS